MIFEEKTSSQLTDLTDYYEVLDTKRHASSSEIRESYLRIKATYQKDNAALYTLISPSEREDMLRRIEEAYQVLSSPELKREYDAVRPSESPFDSPFDEPVNVISIDRAPPMEAFSGEENPLIPPKTDFEPKKPGYTSASANQDRPNHTAGQTLAHAAPLTSTANDRNPFEKTLSTTYQEPVRAAPLRQTPASHSSTAPTGANAASQIPSAMAQTPGSQPAISDLDKEIALQTHWTGPLLRKVRIGRGISIEEVTQATKITKAYILAIEEENYTKLPAPVFIRGFVSQVARQLRLPANDVTNSYMERARQALPDKFKSAK